MITAVSQAEASWLLSHPRFQRYSVEPLVKTGAIGELNGEGVIIPPEWDTKEDVWRSK